jgi:HSP20 family molecular chaperone IbpA
MEKTGGSATAQRPERLRNRRTVTPPTDIFESGDTIVLAVDMPGVTPEGVNIMLEKNVLTLEGNAEVDLRKGRTLAYSEYEPFDYRRTFTLSAEIDRDNIKAQMKDGVLRLTLPKAASAKARKIAVQAS